MVTPASPGDVVSAQHLGSRRTNQTGIYALTRSPSDCIHIKIRIVEGFSLLLGHWISLLVGLFIELSRKLQRHLCLGSTVRFRLEAPMCKCLGKAVCYYVRDSDIKLELKATEL